MKVLFIANELPPMVGGVGRLCANLGYALTLVNIKVDMITTVPSAAPCGAVNLMHTGSWEKWLNRKFVKIVPTLVASFRQVVRTAPRLVIAATCNHEGAAALILRTFLGVPYCVLVHGSELRMNLRSRLRRRLMQRVLRRASFLVANSSYTRELASQIAPATDVYVIPPAILLDRSPLPRAVLSSEFSGDPVLLTTARMVPRKRHEDLIRAVRELRKDYPNLVYYMTGDGPCRGSIADLAVSLEVMDAVRMPGCVDEGTLDRLYRAATVYVSPGSEDGDDVEGFGISLIEASSYGLPVIAAKGGGVGDAVVDGHTGILVTLGDVAELTRSIRRLLADPDLANTMGAQGRTWVSNHFGLERIGQSFAEVISANLQHTHASQ